MNIYEESTKLIDIGERNIIDDIIIPNFPVVGQNFDDCAELPLSKDISLLITTDPCPTPIICEIDEINYYYYGWYTVLINVSDLAAMGAQPAGILISTIMPENMPIADYMSYISGLKEASEIWNCPIIGGNIKDGDKFSSSGTAIGKASPSSIMRRKGARNGDIVYVIGESGYFLASVFNIEFNLQIDDNEIEILEKNLKKPVARIREGVAISKTFTVTSCMDSSDGIISCLYELAKINEITIIVHSDKLKTHELVNRIAKKANIDSKKLFLGWGDWQLVCTVSPENQEKFEDVLNGLGSTFTEIGYVKYGKGQVLLENKNKFKMITNFSSERFSPTSIFTAGLNKYLTFLKQEPLVYGNFIEVE